MCESDLPAPPRFVDNGDGTVTDNITGLMWEQKVECGGVDLSNPHCVENEYTWSSTGAEPDGTLYTDFLRRINLGESLSFDGTTITRAGYTDWRVPNIVELRSILVEPYPCGVSPCIDEIFGPTEPERHWSSSSGTITGPLAAFNVSFFDGFVNGGGVSKTSVSHARAVRSGP